MRIVVASDHAGVDLRQEMADEARELGHEVVDLGPAPGEAVDYPVNGARVGRLVAAGEYDLGMLVCGTGVHRGGPSVTMISAGTVETTADPAGHTARPDVTRLLLNTAPARRVVPMDEFMQAGACAAGDCACDPVAVGCDGDECPCSDPGRG